MTARSDRLLVVREHNNERFTVRDLQTEETYRPALPVPGTVAYVTAVKERVVFGT